MIWRFTLNNQALFHIVLFPIRIVREDMIESHANNFYRLRSEKIRILLWHAIIVCFLPATYNGIFDTSSHLTPLIHPISRRNDCSEIKMKVKIQSVRLRWCVEIIERLYNIHRLTVFDCTIQFITGFAIISSPFRCVVRSLPVVFTSEAASNGIEQATLNKIEWSEIKNCY